MTALAERVYTSVPVDGQPERPNRIYELRRARGWSQHKLAVEAGLTGMTIYRVENGKDRPTPATASAIARALQTTVEDVFGVPA